MPATTLVPRSTDDLTFIKIAREIAIDHHELNVILDRYGISDEEWLWIKENPRFQTLLKHEIEDWQAATNTHERTKLKAAALIEHFLPEANGRLYDPNENLPAKVELVKLLARIAGMGVSNMGVEGGSGEKFSVTINLGADSSLKFEKQLPQKVIEAETV